MNDADTPAMTPRTTAGKVNDREMGRRLLSLMEDPDYIAKLDLDACERIVRSLRAEASAEPAALRTALLAEALYRAGISVPRNRGGAEWYATIATDIAREYAALFREEATSE